MWTSRPDVQHDRQAACRPRSMRPQAVPSCRPAGWVAATRKHRPAHTQRLLPWPDPGSQPGPAIWSRLREQTLGDDVTAETYLSEWFTSVAGRADDPLDAGRL